MRSRRQSGLTLIEVMVAIAIFAVLGVISYRAVSSMSDSRTRVGAELARWRAISRVMQLVDNDLTQLAPRWSGISNAITTEAAITLVKGGERDELRLVRHDGANGGLQHRAYHIDGDKLILIRWSPRDGSSTEDTLLDGVKSLHWRFINSNGQESDSWPPPDPMQQNALPTGVRIDLELADAGLIKRVFSIR
jgi:general secretion pathway protein J